MKQTSVRELMEQMPAAFRPGRAKGANALVQFRLSGQGGGNWYVTIRDGTCAVTEGVSSAPQATMTMAASDYLLVAQGKLGSMKAYLTGRIKVSGDFALLKKFDTWFDR